MTTIKPRTPKIGFISLGCTKALVDSERIITKLRAEGYEIVNTYKKADVIIINTCGFIEDAIQESLEAIGDALMENGKVIVTGCLGKRKKTILEKYPHVLSITEPHAYKKVLEAVHKVLPPKHDPLISLIPPQGIKLTPSHYAYIKIAEGCNHPCTYCIIPELRGPLISRPIGDILNEAKILVDAGVKELLIIAQDTSAYGQDLQYKTDFYNGKPLKTNLFDLANALGNLGIWIRLHYLYPYPSIDEIVSLMSTRKILPYLDVPLQHSNSRILKLMQRPANTGNHLERIQTWRKICPDIVIRSTFIVGFPGETDEEFNELLDFLAETQLDRVGCFKYSPVNGAKANALPNYIPEDIKQERYDRLMTLQSQISHEKLRNKIGQTLPVMIDKITKNKTIGRTMGDAPEIDGQVIINKTIDCQPGDILSITIIDSDEYDLFGKI